MFNFLKKITNGEKVETIQYSYNEQGILFNLNEKSQSNVVSLYNNLFLELNDDGFGKVENDKLLISHSSIYDFLEDDRSLLLALPKYFDGVMEVMHRGFLDKDAQFEVEFFQNNQSLFNPNIIGSVLYITESKHYLLPKGMYLSYQAIEAANKTNSSAKRYSAIEIMQAYEDDRVLYKGLKENDIINKVEKIGIDIIESEEGDLDIYPLISGLKTDFIVRNSTTIANHPNDNLVLTQVEDKKTIRYILEEKQLKGAKTLVKHKRIPKEEANQFKANPESYFKESDIEAIALDHYRLIRVTELRTEPYIGFFGSTKIETPMSQVLAAGEDIILIDKKQVEELIESLDEGEFEKLQKDIDNAKINQQEVLSFNDFESIPINILEPIVKKKLKEKTIIESTKNKNNIKDEFLGINPNDESEIAPQNNAAVKIKHSDKKLSIEWQNISELYEPKVHQLIGFNWIKTLYINNYKGGLLADDMGLGKTFQVIAFINYLYNIKRPQLDPTKQRILIIAPSILLTSWKNEIENIIIDKSAFNVKILQGRNNALKYLCEAFKKSPDVTQGLIDNNLDVIDLLRYNIYITTYETLSKNQLAFANKELFNFEICVFDEAQKIKNPNARVTQAAKAISANTPFTMIVTGTPIENELRDIWSLFDAFDPIYIGPWKAFREQYVKPLNNEENIGKVEKELREKLGDYILRRLKKDHLEGLPQKYFKSIEIPISDDEAQHHQEIINSSLHHMEKLQKLRVLSLHPALLNLEEESQQDSFLELSKPEKFFQSTKMQALLDLLNKIKSKEEKVLIFVIRHAMQTFLQTALEQQYNMKIDIINGKNNKQEIVDRKLTYFEQQEGFNILILSPLAAGVGLTITAANHVIHLERHWNPAKEDQASDRVYRIGQKKDVFIYHLLHTSEKFTTFDMGLNKLIINKKSLSDGTLIPTPAIKDNEIAETFFNDLNEEEKWALMTPEEFEFEIMRIYEKAGYSCHLTTKQPTEAGTDIIAIKGNKTIAIQCKHTRKKIKQNNTALYQLISEAKLAYPDAEYVAVTNYYFNDNAHKLAKEQNIRLIEFHNLTDLVNL